MRTTGLRSEIVIQLTILMTSAVLFSAVLLLTYSEQQMLERTVKYHTSVMNLFSDQLTTPFESDESYVQFQAGLKSLRSFSSLEKFSIVDSAGDFIYSNPAESAEWPVRKKISVALSTLQPLIEVQYQAGLIAMLFDQPSEHILITQPLVSQGIARGCIQARFSLSDIRRSMENAQKIILLFFVFYGLILVLFGSYLLSKTIVKPIVTLRKMARKITSGNLSESLIPEGPKEISALFADLDEMRASLRLNAQQTQIHIEELEKLNHQLEQKRNELVQAAKMSSIGHLAAGMAHEIGNPLGALTGYLDLLQHEPLSESGRQIRSAAQTEAGRIDQLVRELLDYARPDGTKNLQTDCLKVVDSTVRNLVHQGAISSTQLKLELPSTPVNVKISANRLQQVLVNLLMNARDAAPADSFIRLKIKQGSEVMISVINSGEPIPHDQLSVLFDPFFTTKSQNNGRGLGLFVCHNIIQDADGKIEVTSNESETTFSISLPAILA